MDTAPAREYPPVQEDAVTFPNQAPPPGPGDNVVSTIIPYKNPSALAAYYCGVFSLIPALGLLLGPIAVVLGIRGLGFVKENPMAKGTAHAITGIVLGSISSLFNYGAAVAVFVALVQSH
jgi:Domain of unknown function (DUF4190)